VSAKKKDRSGGRKGGDVRECSRCPGVTFVLTDAQARWGESRCAGCRSKDNAAQHAAKRAERAAKARRYYAEHPEHDWKADQKRYRTSEKFKETRRRYRAANLHKVKARAKLTHAIKKGVLVPQPCESCGTAERVHGHHHDYSKPLDVRWLCPACHGREHREVA
jgi:hypothetical protein